METEQLKIYVTKWVKIFKEAIIKYQREKIMGKKSIAFPPSYNLRENWYKNVLQMVYNPVYWRKQLFLEGLVIKGNQAAKDHGHH